MQCFGFLLLILSICATIMKSTQKTFTVGNKSFLKDGKPFNYVSGSMHYSRVPYYYWKDRLDKMYAAGLDAVQTYIPWNVHEPSPGVYDFSGQQNIVEFIKQAQDAGLLVILRAGPYICGEWEFGGFPPWILKENGSIVVRSMDPGYIQPVDRWLSILLPKIEPLLYKNNGPVIMVQVENEYGSYFACDHTYTDYLRNTFYKYLGNDALLFTTDGSALYLLECGAIHNTFTTVDFGPGGNITSNFKPMTDWNQGHGPLVNSEFYTGWLDYWGQNHAHGDTTNICKSLDDILSIGGNVNMYMFEGGTSFGYMNGADPPFNICPTSYDYDAPLTEAGDITPKYTAIREVIGMHKKLPDVPVPPSTVKYGFGAVMMNYVGNILDLLDKVSAIPPVNSTYPLSMEEVGQNYGFILYRTVLPAPSTTNGGNVLQIPGLRDRAHILLDGQPCGVMDRNIATNITLTWKQGQVLDIFVENQGRINFGSQINFNRKGIISNVTINMNTVLQNWQIYSLNFTQLFTSNVLSPVTKLQSSALPLLPSVFKGSMTIPKNRSSADTYLRMDGWSKGQAFINGFNLGRYWPDRGPQVTMYVPSKLIMPWPTENIVMLLELDYTHKPCDKTSTCKVEFVDTPILNGTVHNDKNISGRMKFNQSIIKTKYGHLRASSQGYDLL